jgi:pyruvate formate-lyase activating enzyme-like uncharacterized protein
MTVVICRDTLHCIHDPDFLRYARRYADIEEQTLAAIAEYGLPFAGDDAEQSETERLKKQLMQQGATVANNGKSIHINWLSPACERCRTGVASHTSFLSLKCHRDCYFCFNPNQQDYDYYLQHERDAYGELAQLLDQGMPLDFAALTGGEPLLHKSQSIAFFQRLRQRQPEVHSRLYSAGDPLDRETAEQLQQAGLDEIRFSIKIDDSPRRQQKVLERIALARQYIPTVMVEMPVLPGSENQMRQLLLALDKIGVDGINLLEFCFPFHNAERFKQCGFSLKYPPYQVYYNYWYAGGLAIAGSERLSLELIQFALQQRLKLGIHYCSLENKHTGQIYQQNFGYCADPTQTFSERDYFIRCAKVFGDAALRVETILSAHGQPFRHNLLHGYIQFNVNAISLLYPLDIEICLSSHIIETQSDSEFLLKEVQLARTTPLAFAAAEE